MTEARFRIDGEELAIPLADVDASDAGFEVRSVPWSYRVRWHAGAPGDALARELAARPRDVLLVDPNVRELHLRALDAFADRTVVARADEAWKSLAEGVLPLVDVLARRGIGKGDRVVVVGGGIVQDVGAFAACVYKRGIPFVFWPTTLLSMCDSCIGGKTGINHHGAKNQLALFSAPREVTIAPAFLATLAPREVQSGLGEILKLHVTGGPAMLARYRALGPKRPGEVPPPDALRALILGALAVKRAVVEKDEFELGLRRSMNYGHTIGHAVEALSGYAIPHGHAVTIGMLVVDAIAAARGLLPRDEHAELRRLGLDLLDAATLRDLAALPPGDLTDLLGRDKKASGGEVTLIVLGAVGDMRFVRVPNDEALATTIREALRGIVAEAGERAR